MIINKYKQDFLDFWKSPTKIYKLTDHEIKNNVSRNKWGAVCRQYGNINGKFPKLDMEDIIFSNEIVDFESNLEERFGTGEELVENFTLYVSLKENKKSEFNMIELGAAYGTNIINSFMGHKLINNSSNFYGIAIEASKYHKQMLDRHVRDNNASEHVKTIHGAIHTDKKDQIFNEYLDLESSRKHFGQPIGNKTDSNYSKNQKFETVKSYILEELLNERDYWNYIHIDIQGTEFNLLSANKNILDKKVYSVCIGTHGKTIEKDLLNLFNDWDIILNYSLQTKNQTIFGEYMFGDGVLFVINKNL